LASKKFCEGYVIVDWPPTCFRGPDRKPRFIGREVEGSEDIVLNRMKTPFLGEHFDGYVAKREMYTLEARLLGKVFGKPP
jgi:hypothetical protein